MTTSEYQQEDLACTPEALVSIWEKIIVRYKKVVYDSVEKKNVTSYPYSEQIHKMAFAPPPTAHAPMGTGIFTVDYEDIMYGITLAETDEEQKEFIVLEHMIRNNYDFVVKTCTQAVENILQDINKEFYDYIKGHIIISIRNFVDTTDIPEISSVHIDKFTKTDGIMTQYDEPPDIRLMSMTWECGNGHVLEYNPAQIFGKSTSQEQQDQYELTGVVVGKKCREFECEAALVKELKNERKYSDYAFITIQERNDRVKEGKLPREIHVKIAGIEAIQRFYDAMEPGCYLIVNGPVRLASLKRLNAPVYIESSNIEIVNDENMMEDIPEIEELIKQEIPLHQIDNHFNKLVRSISPSLEGMDSIKTAAFLALLGTDPKRREDTSRMRGELLYLIISSPARGKTDLLKFLSMIRPRSIYTQGRQSSAIGLTAGVGSADQTMAEIKSKKNNRILFGAIALAHGGMCCIDEMEKRKETDYQDISHTMDDWQHISLYKLGIHKDLPAYCSQIHACNPTTNNGLYDPLVPVSEQINFAEWLLSRYDLILAVTDDNSAAARERYIDHVSKTYATVTLEKDFLQGGHKKITKDADNYNMIYLRHEVKYLREKYHPFFDPQSAAWMVMMRFYNTYRQENQLERLDAENRIRYQNAGKSMFIPLLDNRKLNTLIRLAEASARGHRRNEVTISDVKIAVKLVKMTVDVVCPNSRKEVDPSKINLMANKMTMSTIDTINRKYREEMTRRQGLARKFNKFIISCSFQRCPDCHGRGTVRDAATTGKCGGCDGMGGTYNDVSYQTMMVMSDKLKAEGVTEADIVDNLKMFVDSKIMSEISPSVYRIEMNIRDDKIWRELSKQLRYEMQEEQIEEKEDTETYEDDYNDDQTEKYDDGTQVLQQSIDEPIYYKPEQEEQK